MSVTEQGAATINIALSGGVITVTHGEGGAVLQQWTARPGDWERLWQTIITLRTLGGPVV